VSDQQTPYEEPSVEEIDNEGSPVTTAAGNSLPITSG
jgi:hypothetical protein